MTTKELEIQHPEPEPEPRVIGLTGGIGSGKTTVSKFIQEMGFPVYNSDTRAKSIVLDNADVKSKIISLLGKNSYINGEYNTEFVSEQVFENDDLLQKLNHIIHPAVKKDFEVWVQNQNSSFIFKETALLFELKLNEQCFKSILVTAEDNIRIKRVMDRDDKTYREVENIIQKQMPEKAKAKLSDFIIENNSDLETLQSETQSTLKKLISNVV